MNPITGKLGEVRKTEEDKLEDDDKSCTRTIVNAQVQDSGIYYCAVLYDKMIFIGTGTRVVITGEFHLMSNYTVYHFIISQTTKISVGLEQTNNFDFLRLIYKKAG